MDDKYIRKKGLIAMPMQIVTASIDDFYAVNLIVKEGHEEHAEALPHIFAQVDEVMPYHYFCELIESPTSEIFVAKIEGEIAGFAVIELNESPPFDSIVTRSYAYINDFGVKATYQRNGLGKKLFEACVAWAKKKGAKSLELNVWEFNDSAIAFYKNLGMETMSRKMTLPISSK